MDDLHRHSADTVIDGAHDSQLQEGERLFFRPDSQPGYDFPRAQSIVMAPGGFTSKGGDDPPGAEKRRPGSALTRPED
jgi:hypothetical protein